MPASWRSRVSRAAPRLLALLWAAYDGSRALAYLDTSPPQLSSVGAWMPLWAPWTLATMLLILGALVPRRAGPRARRGARMMRQWGMTITLALLLVWGAAFLLADFSRGWVTAASYVMLAFFAAWSGTVSSREIAKIRTVTDEEVDHDARLGQ